MEDTEEFSILDHTMVPLHEILSEDEVEEVLKLYGINKGQLPKMKTSDPVSKQIGAKAGDVVKITRKSHTAGKSIAYRLLIK
ncbi:MAG: DNA-directed RNA polymerase subunit H [Halobacteriota archaeon]|nr:DNA-directed RNA polymerase subunit H [Halobacteriota archaeon]